MTGLRLGVDVGGSFTDLVLFDPGSNTLRFTKRSSTPLDQSIAVADGICQFPTSPAAIEFFAHGTTVATNALLERRGATCALFVTAGFRDVLLIGRQDRPNLYDWFAQRPPPLIPRHLTFEVRERVLHTGEVLQPLDEQSALESIQAARQAGVTAIAVCLLHSYVNPAHERRLAELIDVHFPGVQVSLSCDILPEIKEFERASTTAANAYVGPVVRHYVDALEQRTAALGMSRGVRIMQSNGGVMTARTAGEQSVRTMLSGPAAGVLGAVLLARSAGFDNTLSVDMGGTSFDMCLTHRGEIRFTKDGEIGGQPIRVPMIDIHTLGAGGGSLAWIDAGGALRVGPHSAGAQPGPACYGRGGTQPTVTDANLVLGRLDRLSLLGGEMALDLEAARAAIAETIARPLGLSLEQAAEGIVRVIDATMVRGMRSVSVERGYDPREFCLVAFGGGGPMHATGLARDIGIPTVLIPPAPGVTSALGLLLADLRCDFTATFLGSLAVPNLGALQRLYASLEQQALDQVARDDIAVQDVVLARSAEVRYARQGFELEVSMPVELDAAGLARVRESFHTLHAQHYGYAMRSEEVVLVNAFVRAVAELPKPTLTSSGVMRRGLPQHARQVWMHGRWYRANVVDRGSLSEGDVVEGSAIVEQVDSTAVLLPGDTARVDAHGNLVVTVALKDNA